MVCPQECNDGKEPGERYVRPGRADWADLNHGGMAGRHTRYILSSTLTSPSHLFLPFRHAVQARAPRFGICPGGNWCCAWDGLVGEWTMLLFANVPLVLSDSVRCRFAGSSEELDSEDGERDIEGAAAEGGGAEAGSRVAGLLHRAQRKNMRGQFAFICLHLITQLSAVQKEAEVPGTGHLTATQHTRCTRRSPHSLTITLTYILLYRFSSCYTSPCFRSHLRFQ